MFKVRSNLNANAKGHKLATRTMETVTYTPFQVSGLLIVAATVAAFALAVLF